MKFMKNIKNKKGFLLIEAIIYIFVMSLLLVVILGSAGGYLKNRYSLKHYQQDMEEMSLTINELAKKVRMSNCGEDNNSCTFSDSKLGVVDNIKSDDGTDSSWEIHFDGTTLKDKSDYIILEDVEGGFFFKNGNPATEIPLITIYIQKAGKPQTKMQTSVSQRSGYEL